MTLILAIALQAAMTPQRFSILAPVPDQPCIEHTGTTGSSAPTSSNRADGRPDIVVCGAPLKQQRLPLPDERVPDGATPSNPYVTGPGALAAEGTPCAAMQRGCLVGFGPPLMPIAKAAVSAIKGAFAKKPDKRGRISIPLDDAP